MVSVSVGRKIGFLVVVFSVLVLGFSCGPETNYHLRLEFLNETERDAVTQVSLWALEQKTTCEDLFLGASSPLELVTYSMQEIVFPPESAEQLSSITPRDFLVFAEARDQEGIPFLRACQEVCIEGISLEVILEMRRFCTKTADEDIPCNQIDDNCNAVVDETGSIDVDVDEDGVCDVLDHCIGDFVSDISVWVTITAGTFLMGSPVEESGRDGNEIQHEVTLTRDIEIQNTEVTMAQYEDVMGYLPHSKFYCDDQPLRFIYWAQAAEYCNALSELAGFAHCYTCSGSGKSIACEMSDAYASPYDCPGYRLPTEAEWEYAARSGTTEARYGSLDDVAWWSGNSNGEPHAVAQKSVSPWGLYDMLGNALEWCHDWYTDYPQGPVIDPWGAVTGQIKVKRGGSWGNSGSNTRAANRSSNDPGDRDYNLGFRPVRTLP